MKITGIGTDIVEIARVERILQRMPQRFAERVLHPRELQQFNALGVEQRAAWLAKRFATKEAVSKALGTGIGKHAHLQDIETSHDAAGKPSLQLHGVTLATAQAQGVIHSELSVADERSHALAFVILTGE